MPPQLAFCVISGDRSWYPPEQLSEQLLQLVQVHTSLTGQHAVELHVRVVADGPVQFLPPF